MIAPIVGAVVVAGGAPAAADDSPPLSVPRAALDAALHCPTTFSHPEREPVLLVHGTGMTSDEAWSWGYAEALQSRGYDVCLVDLPGYALGDVQESSEYVVNAVRKIRSVSGRRVDVVGHSQGNIEIRWAVKWWPEVEAAVDDVVFLANPGHGGVEANALCLLGSCAAAAWQSSAGSALLSALNGGDETPGAISYTSLYSYTDEIVVPWSSSVTDGAKNIALQNVCPGRLVTHGGFLYDALAFRLTLDALSQPGPADPRRLPFGTCLTALAPGVSALDLAALNTLGAVAVLGRMAAAPKVPREPELRSYVD